MFLERLGRIAKASTALVPTLVGLVASALLFVDYVRPTPIFCDEGGGCEALKATKYAAVGDIPTPLFGLLGFALLGALALARGTWVRVAHLFVSVSGAGIALYLLNVQRSTGVYCTYCMAADIAMVLTAVAAGNRFMNPWDLARTQVAERYAAMGALILALTAPLLVGFTKKVPVPSVIAKELAKTPKGQATVIDFVDFQCPFCRMTHEEFGPILEAHKGNVRVVRKHVPLTRIHPRAMDAAKAACCGEQLGKGDAMAEALFVAPEAELTREGCEKIAEKLGLDVAAFHACVDDPQTDARIKADTETFRAAEGHGLPTIWIDAEKFEGAQPSGTLEKALSSAVTKAGS